MSQVKSFRYSLNQKIRRIVKWVMRRVTIRSSDKLLDLHADEIKKILLVRATFRMGDSVLATPAISVFRKNFPNARIDFVGAPISRTLFQNLPIDHHFSITRRYPQSSWDYPALIKQLRSVGYDVAVDVSCSQSAMGSFIVGFSRARYRVGLRGEWDRWFNVRIPRPPEKNKYRILSAFLKALGLHSVETRSWLALSSAEKEEGRKKIREVITWDRAPTVGVFVGGRKTWAKRWPIENFCQLITTLYWHGVNVVTFVGPEEKSLIGFFRDALEPAIPLVFEPSSRDFAAMVSSCDLFVTCDSGPMHLACALGTRTIGIFQHPNFDHWGPPPTLGRIVYQPGGCSVEEVLRTCQLELSHKPDLLPALSQRDLAKTFSLVSESKTEKAIQRLELSRFTQRLFFLSRCTQTFLFLAVIIYSSLFPPSGFFEEGTWLDTFSDTIGMASLVTGGLLRFWAASYMGAWTGPQWLKVPTLITRGPYSYVRHPLYIANFLIGIGMIFVLEVFSLIPILLALAGFQFILVVPAEEALLKEKLGADFNLYCELVPGYIPSILPNLRAFSFGKDFPLKELGTLSGTVAVACLFEWLESPPHRRLIIDLLRILS